MEEDTVHISNKRTRVEELKRIAKEKKVIFDITKLIQKDNILESQELITTKQFIFIAVVHQLNIPYIRGLLELIIEHGPILTMISTLAGMFVVGLPLFMLYTFLGHYSRRGYMKVWDCIPIFRGVSYSVAIVMIFSELYNIAVATTAIAYMVEVCSVPYEFEKCPEDAKNCVERYGNFTKCAEWETNQEYFSVQYHLRHKLVQDTTDFHMNVSGLICCLVLWIIIWFLAYQGFQRFSNITIKLSLCVTLLIFVLCTIVIGGYRSSGDYAYAATTKIVFEVKMVGTVIILNCIANEPGTIVFLSAIAPAHIKTSVISAGIFAIKILFTFIILIFFVVIIETTHVHYKIEDPHCMKMEAHDVWFAYVMDVLLDLPWNFMWIIFVMLVYAYFAFLSALYTVTATLESLMEVLPKKLRNRVTVCMMICGSACTFNVYLYLPTGIEVDSVTHLICLRIISMVIVVIATAAIIFIYPISVLVTDVFFLYGSAPHRYWVTAWTIAPLLLLVGLFVGCSHTNFSVELNKIKHPFMRFLPLLPYVLICLPILINSLYLYFNFVKAERKTPLFKPDPTWGPRGSSRKLSRTQFRPDRDLKYRSPILRCKHKCALNSQNYNKEKLNQGLKYKNFVENLKTF